MIYAIKHLVSLEWSRFTPISGGAELSVPMPLTRYLFDISTPYLPGGAKRPRDVDRARGFQKRPRRRTGGDVECR
jgi:hypothetical protein